MVKRNTPTPQLSDFEPHDENPIDIPAVMPKGVEATVDTRVRYNTRVDPANVPTQPRYSNDLRDLATQELDSEQLSAPSDPLTEFCEAWADYANYELTITRLPDPPMRRRPGQEYNRPCFELENLGNIPFAPSNIVYDLQLVNGNSGGAFRLFLHNNDGTVIARLDRVVIPDPPREQPRRKHARYDDDDNYQPRYREIPVAPEPPVKSDSELFIEQMQRDLFQKAVTNALNPPPPPPPPNPLSLLDSEEQLAYGLLKNSNVLNGVVERLAQVASGPERAEVIPTWKDKIAEAGLELVTKNPQVIAQATDIATRALTALVTAFAPRPVINQPIPVYQPAPIQRPPAQRANPAIQAPPPPQPPPYNWQQTDPGSLPETPQPEDDPDFDDDPELIMLEELTKLMLTTKPLSLDDPVIIDLREAYPQHFQLACNAIAAYPAPMLIRLIGAKSDWAADMFANEITGAHLRSRLDELKALLSLPPTELTETNDTETTDNEEEEQTEEPAI